MRFQSFPGRFSVISCAVTSFSENDGLDRRQRCVASQALLAGRGALGWCTATVTYGQFVDHPSNLSVSANGMLRSSILQRVDVVASTMPRSCHCFSVILVQLLADHHRQNTSIYDRVHLPVA